MRLDKFISLTTNLTRTDSKKVILNKQVKVNNIIVNKINYECNENDIVEYNGNILHYEENTYIMMNKPKGYVCARYDNINKTVLDLIDCENKKNLNIVGRLDIDTEGLLILTTDGQLLHNLTSPKKSCIKKYYIEALNNFKNDDEIKISQGVYITLEDKTEYLCENAKLEIIDANLAYMYIQEGKFHQVKKMCECIDNKVVYLKRVQIKDLKLDESLKPGSWRRLTNDEITSLKN